MSDVPACSHDNIIGTGHGQTMQCDDCGYIFSAVPPDDAAARS